MPIESADLRGLAGCGGGGSSCCITVCARDCSSTTICVGRLGNIGGLTCIAGSLWWGIRRSAETEVYWNEDCFLGFGGASDGLGVILGSVLGSYAGALTVWLRLRQSKEGDLEVDVLLVCVDGTERADVVEVVEAIDSDEVVLTRLSSDVLRPGNDGCKDSLRGKTGGAIRGFLSARTGRSGGGAAGRLPIEVVWISPPVIAGPLLEDSDRGGSLGGGVGAAFFCGTVGVARGPTCWRLSIASRCWIVMLCISAMMLGNKRATRWERDTNGGLKIAEGVRGESLENNNAGRCAKNPCMDHLVPISGTSSVVPLPLLWGMHQI